MDADYEHAMQHANALLDSGIIKKDEFMQTVQEEYIRITSLTETPAKESVNHPDHYNWIPNIECIDVVEYFDFNLGNAIKYIWRCGKKDTKTAEEDINKAIWYLHRELSKIQQEEAIK